MGVAEARKGQGRWGEKQARSLGEEWLGLWKNMDNGTGRFWEDCTEQEDFSKSLSVCL